jgi:hypothetical protein
MAIRVSASANVRPASSCCWPGRMREEVDHEVPTKQVQSTRDDRLAFAGVGFSVMNERGPPIVIFGYLDQAKATNARALIEKAIVDAALIAAAGAHE